MPAWNRLRQQPPRAIVLAERAAAREAAAAPSWPVAHAAPLVPQVLSGAIPFDATTRAALRRYFTHLRQTLGQDTDT